MHTRSLSLTLALMLTLAPLALILSCDRGGEPLPAAKKAPEDVAPEPAEPPAEPKPVDAGPSPEELAEKKLWTEAPADLTPPADAIEHESGLRSKVLRPGTGTVKPREVDAAVAHYTVWRFDGKRIDSSWRRGEPRTFRVGEQIAGWKEGLTEMVVGERRLMWIPQDLAFRARPGKPVGMVIWQAELLEVRRPPDAPPDVRRPPKDATRTETGLYWQELSPSPPGGDGRHPTSRSMVRVHYTGWTTDGQPFDSSHLGGGPATFGVSDVIEGWTEGLQLMTVGQKMRFWIPKKLAYKGKKGKPKGMLVFDVELVELGPN